MEKIFDLVNNLPVFVLVFFRTVGIITFAPIYKDDSLPFQLKIGLSMLVAFVIYPTIVASTVTLPTTFGAFFIVIIKEIALGIMIGYIANIVFSTFFIAGDLIGRQMGLQIGSVVDPQLQTQTTPLSLIFYLIAALLFLSLNGHHWFIKALSTSFASIPIGQINYSTATISKVINMFKAFFTAGVSIAAPFIVILLLVLTALGLASRVAPQIQIFFLAFPIKLLLGFSIIGLSMPLLVQTIKTILVSLQREIPALLATVK